MESGEYEGNRANTVYDWLLSGKSILSLLRAVHKSRPFSIHIAIAYLKEVKKMRQEQINTIRSISEKIILLAQKTGWNVLVPEEPQFVGALGAALILQETG